MSQYIKKSQLILIIRLSAVFGEKILLGAVDLVQKNRVSKLKCPSGRVLYEVSMSELRFCSFREQTVFDETNA